MEYDDWEQQSRPVDFDQYLNGINNMESLFNETLTGISDLDVPTGFPVDGKYKQHSRKVSGTAIFGYYEHGKQLSISGKKEDEIVITPSQLIKEPPYYDSKPIFLSEEDELKPHSKVKSNDEESDFIVNSHNNAPYKFPPSPPSNLEQPSGLIMNNQPNSHMASKIDSQPSMNIYNAKYLQEFSDNKPIEYADDIGPLLEGNNFAAQSSPFMSSTQKYVPIPVQVPSSTNAPQNTINKISKHDVYLPPPSPPNIPMHSNESPEWSSPEPQSPSPSRVIYGNNNPNFSSPLHPNQMNGSRNFYTPQFFSDNNPVGFVELGQNNLSYRTDLESPQKMCYMPPSSPVPESLNSSPVKFTNSSPLRNVMSGSGAGPDDSIDVNATIVQLTPQKDKVDLKWSPIISPNAKGSRDVRRTIQQLTPKRKVEKTSLLPPGELDQYWEGPDENKVFTCKYNGCGKKFTRRYNVRSHIQTHLSDRPFACPYCPKKFVRQHDLNRHIKGHQETRYCKCVCGKEFSRLDALRKHKDRNICVGGVPHKSIHSQNSNDTHAASGGGGIIKPKRKAEKILIDELTTDILTEELRSTT